MADLFGRGGWVLILIVIVVFGSKKLPDAARSLGRSIRIFKSEIEGGKDGQSDKDDSDGPNTNSPLL